MDRRIFISVIILVSLVGCLSDGSQNSGEKSSSETAEVVPTTGAGEDLSQVSNLLAGYWISDDFLTRTERSKSVFATREYSSKLFGLALETENLLGDEPYLDGFTEHEGGYGTPLKFNTVKGVFENDMEKLEPYSFLNEPFEVHLRDQNTLEIRYGIDSIKELYRRVADVQTSLRRTLFEGIYINPVSSERVEFKRDGQLNGIPSKQRFEVLYDFESAGYQFDVVSFLADGQVAQDTYHYRIKKDTLSLFSIEGDFPEFSIGEKKYQWIREK